jgi:hypothetical protein
MIRSEGAFKKEEIFPGSQTISQWSLPNMIIVFTKEEVQAQAGNLVYQVKS